jgi:hypothetical protein
MVGYLDGDELEFVAADQLAARISAGRAIVVAHGGFVDGGAGGTAKRGGGLLDVEARALGGGAGSEGLEGEPKGFENDARKRPDADAQGADAGAIGGRGGILQEGCHEAQFVHLARTVAGIAGAGQRKTAARPGLFQQAVDKLCMGECGGGAA